MGNSSIIFCIGVIGGIVAALLQREQNPTNWCGWKNSVLKYSIQTQELKESQDECNTRILLKRN